MLVRNIQEIDDVANQYKLQLTFRQKWTDDRLKFNSFNGQIKYINLVNGHYQIWKPDTFFKNEREGHFHNMLTPNQLVRVYPDGTVLYSVRVSLVLFCPMNLRYYPADRQVCQIELASCKCDVKTWSLQSKNWYWHSFWRWFHSWGRWVPVEWKWPSSSDNRSLFAQIYFDKVRNWLLHKHDWHRYLSCLQTYLPICWL